MTGERKVKGPSISSLQESSSALKEEEELADDRVGRPTTLQMKIMVSLARRFGTLMLRLLERRIERLIQTAINHLFDAGDYQLKLQRMVATELWEWGWRTHTALIAY